MTDTQTRRIFAHYRHEVEKGNRKLLWDVQPYEYSHLAFYNHIVDGLYANGVKLYNVSREDRRKFKKALCCMPLHLKVVMDMHVKTTR
jgi:hypothetical protein